MAKFVCKDCQSILSVPDAALPGKDLSGLRCAVCHGAMVAEPVPVQQGDEVSVLQTITAGGQSILLAIAEESLAARVAQAMSGFAGQIVHARTPRSVLTHLEEAQYDVVILHEPSASQDLPEDPVLRYLQQLPMTRRRAVLLCLISGEKTSLDFKAAFRAGVDLVVNVRDIEQFQTILEHAMKQHETSYRMLEEEFRRRGSSPV